MRDALLAAIDRLGWCVRRHRALTGCVLSAAVVGVLVVGALAGLHAAQRVQQDSATPIAPIPRVTPSRSVATSAPTRRVPGDTPSETPSARRDRSLHGRGLATAWLTGYLTRSSRSDDGWVAAVRDLTAPDLLQQLTSAGPEVVGLEKLDSWRVDLIVPIEVADAPVDTPSRQVLAYAAVVTDGQRRVDTPFQLYCYRGVDGRWLVGAVEQLYASEG